VFAIFFNNGIPLLNRSPSMCYRSNFNNMVQNNDLLETISTNCHRIICFTFGYFSKKPIMNYRGIIASYGIKEVESNQLELEKVLLEHVESIQNLIDSTTTHKKAYANTL
jgi:hypothetical protein